MKSKNTLLCIIVWQILCSSSSNGSPSGNSEQQVTTSSKCPTGVVTVASEEQEQYVMGAPTQEQAFSGLVDDHILVALKITQDFHYMHIRMNFGEHEYESPHITAEDLYLNKEDGLWNQLWIDLGPAHMIGIGNWHLYIKSDHIEEALGIDTGFEWHWAPYKPRLFTVFAAGKSYWIPHGNASVCNVLDTERHTELHHPLMGGSSTTTTTATTTNIINTTVTTTANNTTTTATTTNTTNTSVYFITITNTTITANAGSALLRNINLVLLLLSILLSMNNICCTSS